MCVHPGLLPGPVQAVFTTLTRTSVTTITEPCSLRAPHSLRNPLRSLSQRYLSLSVSLSQIQTLCWPDRKETCVSGHPRSLEVIPRPPGDPWFVRFLIKNVSQKKESQTSPPFSRLCESWLNKLVLLLKFGLGKCLIERSLKVEIEFFVLNVLSACGLACGRRKEKKSWRWKIKRSYTKRLKSLSWPKSCWYWLRSAM